MMHVCMLAVALLRVGHLQIEGFTNACGGWGREILLRGEVEVHVPGLTFFGERLQQPLFCSTGINTRQMSTKGNRKVVHIGTHKYEF